MLQYRNREWLEGKYINEKLSTRQIAKLCNANQCTIWKWLHKYNILVRSSSESIHLAKANHCDLSQEAIEWINGELLGDGCLKLVSQYSARFTYGSKYPEYIRYVKYTLKSFGIEEIGKIEEYYDKRFGCYSYNCCSRSYVELLKIYKQWYPEGKKIIPKNLKLTPLTLRQHYIGDGYLNKIGNSSIQLCTYGFTKLDVKNLLNKIIKLGIKAKVTTRNAIRIPSYSVKDFLNYIGDCPVECYKYKWRTMKYASLPV